MDAIAEGTPKPLSKLVDLSVIKTPEIREFTAQQLPKLDWLQEKDTFAGLPPVKFNFYFSAHASPADVKGWREPIQQADIWIPELNGWTESARQVYQSVSDGKETSTQALDRAGYPRSHSSFLTRVEELGFLYGRRIPTEFVDVSKTELSQLPPQIEGPQISSGDKFEEMMIQMREWIEKNSDYQIMREVLILSNLKDAVIQAAEKIPDLKSKDELNILLTLGSSHTWIYQILEKHGFSVHRDFSTNPMIFGFEAEAIRNIRYGKALSNELVANMVFSNLIEQYLPNGMNPEDSFDKITPFIRRGSSAFSIGEKTALYNECMLLGKTRYFTPSEADSAISTRIENAFRQKGIQFET